MKLAQVENGVVVNVIEVDPGRIPDWAADWPEVTSVGPGWTRGGDGEFAPPAPRDPADILAAERATLNPYRLAFRRALLSVSFPGFDHALAKVETVAAAARQSDRFGPVSIWWDNVQQFIRTHPDVETFRTHPAFYPNDRPMTEAKVDALFRVAQAIDDGADSAIAGLIADFEAEPWN